MILIGYQNCSTCKQVEKYLKDKQIDFVFREIIQETPTATELANWYQTADLKTIKGLINTSGQKYKELKLKDKISSMTEDEIFDLLSTDGMLIKRPILLVDENVYIGKAVQVYIEGEIVE